MKKVKKMGHRDFITLSKESYQAEGEKRKIHQDKLKDQWTNSWFLAYILAVHYWIPFIV